MRPFKPIIPSTLVTIFRSFRAGLWYNVGHERVQNNALPCRRARDGRNRKVKCNNLHYAIQKAVILVMQAIRKREALLAWALKNGDKREAERLKHELLDLVETAF